MAAKPRITPNQKQIFDALENLGAEQVEHLRKLRDAKVLVGQAMREHREAAGISQRELARRMGCSPSFMGDMELGRRLYSIYWSRMAFEILEKQANKK